MTKDTQIPAVETIGALMEATKGNAVWRTQVIGPDTMFVTDGSPALTQAYAAIMREAAQETGFDPARIQDKAYGDITGRDIQIGGGLEARVVLVPQDMAESETFRKALHERNGDLKIARESAESKLRQAAVAESNARRHQER